MLHLLCVYGMHSVCIPSAILSFRLRSGIWWERLTSHLLIKIDSDTYHCWFSGICYDFSLRYIEYIRIIQEKHDTMDTRMYQMA